MEANSGDVWMRDAGLILMIVLGVLLCLVALFFDAGWFS
jgi:hypothetical protein